MIKRKTFKSNRRKRKKNCTFYFDDENELNFFPLQKKVGFGTNTSMH